jgi:hypothetical protein
MDYGTESGGPKTGPGASCHPYTVKCDVAAAIQPIGD